LCLIFIIGEIKMIKLNKAVGSSYLVDLNDVKPVKAALHKLGYYNPPKWGITEIPDKAMMDGIKSFQKDNHIYPNGVMHPEDTTETAINQKLSGKGNRKTGKYIWHTIGDSKVRSKHAERNGKVFDWAHPPEGGHPGEDYNCRCRAENISVEEDREKEQNENYTNITEGLTQEVISPINDASYRWNTNDFVNHFYKGKGRPLFLEEVGLLGSVIEHARKIMFYKVENQIVKLLRKKGSGSFWGRWSNSYPFGDLVFSFGNVTIKGTFDGIASQNGDVMSVQASVYYTFMEDFTDPADMRDVFIGSELSKLPNNFLGASAFFATECGGEIYNITGKWETLLTDSFKLNE
jgi:SPP1 gp7 family putative phage head morphogenesis protein